VAGFDVIDQPIEVKKRIGYLPEAPPLYPEMETGEYLEFVGKLKGVPKAELRKRVDDATERCAIGDVRKKLLGKLSKGYRQRVGLAQAILHNPDVLILDEPTSGLDPKQIHETRSLIASLAGDHTIILSTHILPEVEQVCERVIIINRGRIVATDTVQHLTNRLRGSESILVEVESGPASVNAATVLSRLEQVGGVSRVISRESRGERMIFEVESLQGRSIRADLARAIVQSGWNLSELRPVALSLEEVFLELTSSDAAAAATTEAKK
jgi:ABC-2 type transport system ATP-binding protein